MSAKACLLCGKTLSRIWSGAGEDFCSREHRNQYRLRRGMDRLQEANKVANVMRRRENPRQIAPSSLSNPGTQSPRGYLQSRTAAAQIDPSLVLPLAEPSIRPRLSVHSGALPPSALAGASLPAREGMTRPLTFPRRKVSIAAALEPRTPARVSRAPMVALAHAPADIDRSRRILPSPWRASTPLVVGNLLRRVQPSELNPVDAARTARRLFAPSEGRALRVSMGVGFPVKKCGPPPVVIAHPEPAGMTWPVMINLSEEPLERLRPHPIAEAIPISIPGMRIPVAPSWDARSQFRWPGVFELPVHFVSPAVRHWTAHVPFGNAEEGPGKEHLHEYRN
jgi:hypothetical protein